MDDGSPITCIYEDWSTFLCRTCTDVGSQQNCDQIDGCEWTGSACIVPAPEIAAPEPTCQAKDESLAYCSGVECCPMDDGSPIQCIYEDWSTFRCRTCTD